VFRWLQDAGGRREPEMLRTFNGGIGMVVCVASEDGHRATAELTAHGETVQPHRLDRRSGGAPRSGAGRRGMSAPPRLPVVVLISGAVRSAGPDRRRCRGQPFAIAGW